MNSIHASSSPQLAEQGYNDSALEGVTANVKLLLKLIQDHKLSTYNKEKKDVRRMLRVATMMTIIDNIRNRIQKCQAFGGKRAAEVVQDHPAVDDDEKAMLRKELKDSLAARKSLEVMCSSLGREKEIIAAELAMKVHQLEETDEFINDLKDRNGTLLEKLHECSSDSKEDVVETQENMELQERNKVLSDQYLLSLDDYRSMERKYKEAQEENNIMCATMEDIGMAVRTSLDRIHDFKDSVGSDTDIQDQIVNLEQMLESLDLQVAKHEKKKGECLKPEGAIITHHPQIVS